MICKKWTGLPDKGPSHAPLPELRLAGNIPFQNIGTDFCGPLYFWLGRDTYGKCYICIFSCAVTRALHLEVIEDMSANSFILALRRFMSIRGQPQCIVSDNAKSFQMTRRTLELLWADVVIDEAVQDYVANIGITWKFNTPRASWHGGFFERLIGSVKRTLKKSVGKSCLSFIELQTEVTEIAAILNTRPLVYVYDTPDEGYCLTPNHFLCPTQALSLPLSGTIANSDEIIQSSPMSTAQCLIGHLKARKALLDQFWNAWRMDYLTNLRELDHIKKRGNKEAKYKIGDIVLIQENLPRAQWKMGRVVELKPGIDGKVRSVKLFIGPKKLQIERPVQKLVPLELEAGVSNN